MSVVIDYEDILKVTNEKFVSEIKKEVESNVNHIIKNEVLAIHTDKGKVIYSVIIMFKYGFVIAEFFYYKSHQSISINRVSSRDIELIRMMEEESL